MSNGQPIEWNCSCSLFQFFVNKYHWIVQLLYSLEILFKKKLKIWIKSRWNFQRFVFKWFACIYRYQFILFFFFKFANRAVALLITYLGGGITLYILLGNIYLYKMRSALQAEFNISKHAKCADVCNSLDVITRFILILNFGEARIERVKRKKFIICY